MAKYEIINEVTDKELMDLRNRVEASKGIFMKRIEHND